MHRELYRMHYGNYTFMAEIDMGAEVGANQITVWFREKGAGDESRFLRSFYFEEANDDNIHTFCREFALYPDYRREVLTGERHWARRNALFVRNLYPILGERVLLADDIGFEQRAHDLFRWFDIHTEAIEASPEYRQLLRLDDAFPHCTTVPEPLIQPAVALLQQIPGVVIGSSCQGVAGKLHFRGYELLAVSQHEEFAYVSFERLSYFTHDMFTALLPDFPHLSPARLPCNFSSSFLLRSTGDNQRFRAELMTMAQIMLAIVREEKRQVLLEPGLSHWEAASYPERQPRLSTPGGLLPSRLAWLCRPERIERTLELLFHLNHWAKASSDLFYVDRQGLYTVKATLIEQAYAASFLQPVLYIDGIAAFTKDFTIEIAADIATEFLFERLSLLLERRSYGSPRARNEYDQAARQLFTRICGRIASSADDIDIISEAQARRYILAALYGLIDQARLTRQPIPFSELAALLIGPNDLLALPYNREHLIEFWHELDETNARKLDPERTSLIAFQYSGAGSSYTFHLPFRLAERFLPHEIIQRLRQHAGYSRELGIHYGRAITQEESQAFPLSEILYELAVSVDSICPRKLANKAEFYASALSARGYLPLEEEERYDENEDGEIREEGEEYRSSPDERGRSRRSHRASRGEYRAHRHLWPTCPRCKCVVDDRVSARIAHWREAHTDQDLTISQASWVLRQRDLDFKIAQLKPDYRDEGERPRQQGARYWKIETLEAYAAREGVRCG